MSLTIVQLLLILSLVIVIGIGVFFRHPIYMWLKKYSSIFKKILTVGTVVSIAGAGVVLYLNPPVGDPPFQNTEWLGYEFLDSGTVFHIWNNHNDYYFNRSNGIQFSNHYEEYWTKNVLMLGYYSSGNWNLLYRIDELSGFNEDLDCVTNDYINATLWKDLSYGNYDFRLAIRYHLKTNDSDLTVVPYIKNLGISIPFDIGFGWEMKDIKIANVTNDNYLQIYNNTDKSFDRILLNQTLDESFTDLDKNTTIRFICTNPPSPFFSRDLYLSWNPNLTYKVTCKSRSGQYNAPTTLFIKVGTLGVGQEKSTKMHWLDADDWLGISSAEYDSHCGHIVGYDPQGMLDGTGNWRHAVDETHWLILDLGQTYTITKVRGRSGGSGDPIYINIYIDDNNPPTTLRKEGITTWQDTIVWVEISFASANGRYIKIEIEDTEKIDRELGWYAYDDGYLTCFDAYGDVYVPPPSNAAPTSSNEAPTNSTDCVNYVAGGITTHALITDPDGDSMNVTWWSNSSGSWKQYGVANTSVSNNTNISMLGANFTTKDTWYHWWMLIDDGEGGACNDTYRFKLCANNAPTFANEAPTNASTDVSLQKECYVVCNDADGSDTLTVDFYSNESDGSTWVWQSGNTSVSPADNISFTFTNADTANTKYWWRVYSNDGTVNSSDTYDFTTASAAGWDGHEWNLTIRNNDTDYFIWLGSNCSAYNVSQQLTGFDEDNEYIGIWDNDTWSDTNASWQRYNGDGDGVNFTVTTFMVIQIKLTDSGTQEINMHENHAWNYTNSKTYTWTNNTSDKGNNYTGKMTPAETTLSAINSSVTLQKGEGLFLWNRTHFKWTYYSPHLGITDDNVEQFDIILSKVENSESWST